METQPETRTAPAPETSTQPPSSSRTKDYVYLLIAFCGLIAAYLVWEFVLAPKEIRLVDLDYTVESFQWMEPKINTSIDGNPLKIGNTIYTHGLGVHANTEISLKIPKGMKTFLAEVGVDAEMVPGEHPSSVRFMVQLDGVLAPPTEIIRAGEQPHQLSIPVEGHTHMLLIVDDAGDGNHSDHADWANARFVR